MSSVGYLNEHVFVKCFPYITTLGPVIKDGLLRSVPGATGGVT